MEPYDPSQVLFRYAKDLTVRAAELRTQFEQSADVVVERRNREADHCLGAIIMAHSSLEAWINQVSERSESIIPAADNRGMRGGATPWSRSPLP